MGLILKTAGWSLAGFVGLVLIGNQLPKPPEPERPVTVIPQSMRDAYEVEIKAIPKRNSVAMIIGFSVNNKNSYALKDLDIYCQFFGQSGTVLKSVSRTAYRVFPAGKTTRVDELNFGFLPSEAATLDCKASAAQRA